MNRKNAKLCNKKLTRKNFERLFLCSKEQKASTETAGSAFLERARKVQNSEYKHVLLKLYDCFIDGYGINNGDRVKIFEND